jgi:hypothetical protein
MTKKWFYSGIYVAALAAGLGAMQGGAPAIDNDDIGGVVRSATGPEAGVWVVAETTETPTRFIRTVVTDDQGRYVMPDLPAANFDIWVRGYGLVDSPKVKSARGRVLNLTAVTAPNEKAAAEIYPANYWFAMLKMPERSMFPIPGSNAGNANPMSWHRTINTDSCISCHQIGNKPTREFAMGAKPADHVAAWDQRVKFGPDGSNMDNVLTGLGREFTTKMFADWTTRIQNGETPFEKPARPVGAERNVVVTMWDWSDGKSYFHDVIASDKRDPKVSPNGKVFGVHENSSDMLTWVDPVANSAGEVPMPRSPKAPAAGPGRGSAPTPSPYWGDEQIWATVVNGHSNEIDQLGRVWNTANTGVTNDLLPFCSDGNLNPSARMAPIPAGRGRKFSIYDPKANKWDFADTCFGSFHLNMAFDAPNHSMVSGAGGYVGWFSTKIYAETGDHNKAQKWTDLVVDTNGSGRREPEYNQPAAGGRGGGRAGGAAPAAAPAAPAAPPAAPAGPDFTKDTRIGSSCYAVAVSPTPDGSVWCTTTGTPGTVFRTIPGANPPETALTEVFAVPAPGFGPRGGDVDAEGVMWAVLASGHLASFDRRKCTTLARGQDAVSGNHCQQAWTLTPVPGPNYKGDVVATRADSNYYNWSDKYNSLGMGDNVQIATSNQGGALLALKPAVAGAQGDAGTWTVLRVPYPLGFYAKSINGRIDDPNTGWKGRGLWTGWANRNPWHNEPVGKGVKSKAIKFQYRPNPLAK